MRSRAVIAVSLVVGVAVAALPGASPGPASASALTRVADPVVMDGADIPALVNQPKGTIVGFRWTGSAWQQLPIQIDERAVVSFGKIYNDPNAVFYNSRPGLVNELVYTSGATWTGNDPNAKFDADDELVFMARDAGVESPGGSQPAGTKPGTGVEVRISDPLDAGGDAFVYLFHRAAGSGLQQGARTRYLTYRFRLLSGAYKKTYGITAGPNPENSLVTGATYKRRFADRWLTDQLIVTAPGSTAVDILDRHKVLFSPGFCGRSEDTFDVGEGAFVVNKNGPVRVIRSYLGANSGPSTQRTHLFYDRREDVVTDLRTHAIPSVMDFVDYAATASGMTYRSSLDPAGVTIDGAPDTLTAGVPQWEQVTGPQGTLTYVQQMQTTWTPGSVTSFHQDDTTPALAECTSDAFAYGQHGMYVNSSLPSTDPALGGTDRLRATRTIYYDAPGGTAATAAGLADAAVNPLVATATGWLP